MATNKTSTSWTPQQKKKFDQIMAKSNSAAKSEQERVKALNKDGLVEYTIFVSGLRHGGRASELEDKNQTDNLAIIFDSVERHNYTKSYTKTSYAVESKSKASDNVVAQDGKVSFTGRITDSPMVIDQRNYIDKDTNKDKPLEAKRPAKAMEFLTTLADARQTVTLVMEDNILSNYVITELAFERSTDEGAALVVNISLEEFRFKAITKTVLARTTDPKKKGSGSKNSGTKQTAEGGAADDAAKKKKSPYLGKTQKTAEYFETQAIGTTDFENGTPGAQIKPSGPTFDPGSILRK